MNYLYLQTLLGTILVLIYERMSRNPKFLTILDEKIPRCFGNKIKTTINREKHKVRKKIQLYHSIMDTFLFIYIYFLNEYLFTSNCVICD